QVGGQYFDAAVLRRQLLETVDSPGHDNERDARLAEQFGHRFADPAGRPGDQCRCERIGGGHPPRLCPVRQWVVPAATPPVALSRALARARAAVASSLSSRRSSASARSLAAMARARSMSAPSSAMSLRMLTLLLPTCTNPPCT